MPGPGHEAAILTNAVAVARPSLKAKRRRRGRRSHCDLPAVDAVRLEIPTQREPGKPAHPSFKAQGNRLDR
jgi:hypothetical protein